MDVVIFIKIILTFFAIFCFFKSYQLWKITLPEKIKADTAPKIYIPNEFIKELNFFITSPRDKIFDNHTVKLISEKLNLSYDKQSGCLVKYLNNNLLYKFFNSEDPNSFIDNQNFQTKSLGLRMLFPITPFGTDNLSAFDSFAADIRDMLALSKGELSDKNQRLVSNFQKYREHIYHYHHKFLRFLEAQNAQL